MRKMKNYEAPTIKVVSFQVEGGFAGSILQNGTATDGVINFGGTDVTGLVTQDPSTNHSGLGQYGYNEGLFGSN